MTIDAKKINYRPDILSIVKRLGIRVYRINKGELSCFCPLHKDDNPSLGIRIADGTHQCWAGCSKGSIETLVKNVLGVSDAEAKRFCGGALQDVSIVSLVDALDPPSPMELVPFVEECDLSHPLALGHPYLLDNREMTNKDIHLWDIRFDEIRNCFLLPVRDESGILVNITTRFLNIEKGPKYMHLPGMKINDYFYGEWLLSDEKDSIILVEGPFDVIRLHQAGFHNVLGIFGVDITAVQLKKLLRRTDNGYLGLDNDNAGCMGSERISRKLFGKMGVFHVFWPQKDPGECSISEIIQSIQEAKGELFTRLANTINNSNITKKI